MSKRLRVVLMLAAPLVVYVGSYIILSARGGWYWSQTGKLRYDFGFAASDVERWFPAWAHWEPFRDIYGRDTSRGDLQGYIYSPLIRLDRAWVHPDREVFPATRPAS
jgi:hypothetical protein